MKNLYQLQTFVTVIAEGSMTAAADKLYLTQPAVSQQIRNLEEDLGVELLVRGVRQIKATPQGEILYEQAKKILALVQQAEISIKSIGAELKGTLRVGTMNSIGLHLMSPIVGRLMRHNPELCLKFEYGKGDELVRLFKKGSLDVVILPETQSEFDIEVEGADKRFLQKEEMWLVGAGKEVGLPSQISLKEIGTYPLVHFAGEYPGFNKKMEVSLGNLGSLPPSIFESSNVGTLKRVIETGLGWGFLPSHSIRKQVRSGRLSRIHVRDFSYDVDLYFYSKKGGEGKLLAEVLFQTLSKQEKYS